jgi:hypothetical protein
MLSLSVHQIGERGENQLGQSRFMHLDDGLRAYCKQLFPVHQPQRLQFQGQSRQSCFDLWTYLSLINEIASLGKFFFAIAGLMDWHDCEFPLIIALSSIITDKK